MWVRVVALVVLLAGGRAYAGGQIGVVGAGDPALRKKVVAHVERWLEQEGHKLVGTPLSRDAANTLANCFVIEDLKCARGVVELRTKAISLVFVAVELDGRKLTFTVYWFVKGREPIGEKQSCEGCAEKWQPLLETVMRRLGDASKVDMGKLSVTSDPAGLAVLLDDVKIGATPIERDVPAGKHTITLTHRGSTVATRDVDVGVGATSTVTIAVELDDDGKVHRPSRLGPALLLAGGVVAAGAGSVLIYRGSRDDVDTKWIYPAWVPGGIALCVVGGGAIIGGGILLLKAGFSNSAPVVAVSPGGAYVGWVSRF